MFALKNFKVIIFDCYGTLCDWESGIYDALQPLLVRYPESAKWTRKEALLGFHRDRKRSASQRSKRAYIAILLSNAHAVLAETLAQEQPSADLDATEHAQFGASIKDWAIFPDTCAALRVLQKHYKLVILSNVDQASFAHTHAKLSGATDPEADIAIYTRPAGASTWLPQPPSPFSLILTAQDTGAYKPDPKGMLSALEIIQREFGVEKDEVLVVAQSLYHDIDPASALGVSGVWINREAVMGLESIDQAPKWRARYATLAEMAEAVEAEK
ncbi:HAD-like domain-containing protein [Mycena amicta]|nr:HAD-like domain-containing protein [Mycena amicta]